ncbi:MAG: MMPL family transporter, partial [Lysobacterales bacterium]
DGSAVLLAETRAPAVDITAQSQAIHAVKQAFANLPGSDSLKLELTGVGAFSVELQNTIRAEAQKRTILAMTALLTVLLVLYRKFRLLLLAALPVGMGFVVGLAMVALVFDSVHGITLAFGFTLMGVAIDYPLHLFSHARLGSGHAAIKLIWPTLRIGAASTAIAYIAIALSGSEGLAQLGIFTASGVIVAALVTRYWLPLFIVERPRLKAGAEVGLQQPSLAFSPVTLILLLTLLGARLLLEDGMWDDTLSSLSPVPEPRLMTDNVLRSAAGTPDMRYQLVLHAASLETLLRESESVDLLLQQAVHDGLLQSWQSVSLLLPSRYLQKKRQDAIPDSALLHARLSDVVAETSFRVAAFEPFENNARTAKTLEPLMPAQFEATPLASWLGSHLIHVGGQWVSLVSMGYPDPQALALRLKTWEPQVELIDLQQSTIGLMRDYRNSALKTIAYASLVIIALLLFEQKQARKVFWIVLTVMGSLTVTIVSVAILHSGLTIIHLVGLLLVMGLGLDYALFLSRTETAAEQKATRHAVVACALTTTLTFGILAGSSIPVLKFLGLTVATGSAASFILAFAGSRVSKKALNQSDD